MIVPNAENAFIDMRKLEEYCLNPEHPTGKHKAHIFETVLGLTVNDTDILKEALLQAVKNRGAETGEIDEYGQRYIIDFEMTTAKATATVRSAWIIRNDEDFPGLASCYVL